jgi:hypothetical protein
MGAQYQTLARPNFPENSAFRRQIGAARLGSSLARWTQKKRDESLARVYIGRRPSGGSVDMTVKTDRPARDFWSILDRGSGRLICRARRKEHQPLRREVI